MKTNKTKKIDRSKRLHKLTENEGAYDWIQRTYAKDADGKLLYAIDEPCGIADGSMDQIIEATESILKKLSIKRSKADIVDQVAMNNAWTNGQITIVTERWTTADSEPLPNTAPRAEKPRSWTKPER